MRIKLTGWVTNKPETVTEEEAIEVLRDTAPEYRLSEKVIREKWARGEAAESDMFTAEPMPESGP